MNTFILKSILLVFAFALVMSNTTDKFLEQEGTANNFGTKNVEAVNSGFAKTNNKDVMLTNDPHYKSPVITLKLPLRKPIESGEPISSEEIPGADEYYNGALGIKHSASFCNQFVTKPQACVHQGSCGWCMGEGTCVSGNTKGPITNGDCLRGKYVFEAPNADWNPVTIPNAVLSRTNVLGAQLTTIVQQPDKTTTDKKK